MITIDIQRGKLIGLGQALVALLLLFCMNIVALPMFKYFVHPSSKLCFGKKRYTDCAQQVTNSRKINIDRNKYIMYLEISRWTLYIILFEVALNIILLVTTVFVMAALLKAVFVT